MRLLGLNLLAISCIGGPLLLLEIFGPKVSWFEAHKESINFILWLACIAVGFFCYFQRWGYSLIPVSIADGAFTPVHTA